MSTDTKALREAAAACASAIEADLTDRSGCGWDDIDDETQGQIREAWTTILTGTLHSAVETREKRIAELEAALAQARADGRREGVGPWREAVEAIEALPTFMDNHVAGITVNRYAVLSRLRALLPDSADDREARVQNVLRHIEDGTGDALWAERMKGTPHGPVAARWASRPVEERKALLADALSGEGITQGPPKGGES